MRLKAAEFSFIEEAGDSEQVKNVGVTRQVTVLREVKVFHTEF
jgi:hypothetical protein